MVRLRVRLDFFGIRVCMFKLKELNRSLCLLKVYVPNATSEYQAFVDEVNDALIRVPTESTVLREISKHTPKQTQIRGSIDSIFVD